MGKQSKRSRNAPPSVDDFLLLGREVQNKCGRGNGGTLTEDSAFHECFGISAVVALVLWNMLVENELVGGNHASPLDALFHEELSKARCCVCCGWWFKWFD